MGREIRKVPPNWEHPKDYRGRYTAMFDEQYEDAAEEWKREYDQFYATGKNKEEECEFWEWNGGPPEKRMYRPYKDREATWFQVYETVSEGTPVTPPFETKEEIVAYLVEHGDFWDQNRRRDGNSGMSCDPWSEKAARNFVFGHGHLPSMVVANGEILSGGPLAEKF